MEIPKPSEEDKQFFRSLLPPLGRRHVRHGSGHALAHLGDQALTPQAVARANYISVRQLRRLFAREGISFGTWVLEQRLRRCRTDLTDHQISQGAVAEVATSWGFRSAAHFSRAFHARYGTMPAGLRRAARLRTGEPVR